MLVGYCFVLVFDVSEHGCHDNNKEIWGERAALSDASVLWVSGGIGVVNANKKAGVGVDALDVVNEFGGDLETVEWR